MALKTFFFVVTNCLCIYLCYSMPPPSKNVSFATFVLDGKNDCGLANHDQNVIKIFKIISCPIMIRKFSTSYFEQRDILPCFGAYDALYNLCEFPRENISFVTPVNFKDPKKFCTEGKVVYDNLPFTYKNDEMKKWGNALLSTMTNEVMCTNLCLINNEINEQCIAMVTFANEYKRLKGVPGSNVKPLKSDTNTQPNDIITNFKPTSVVKTASMKDSINGSNTTKPNNTLTTSAGDFHAPPPKVVNDTLKVSESAKQNNQGELKPSDDVGNKLGEQPSVAETHKTEGNIPEIETRNKEINTSNNEKSVITSPGTGISSTPKASPYGFEDGMIDENDKTMIDANDKTMTEGDDIHGENEEAMPGEAKEKPNPDEENEKPNEEEKNTASEVEQHAAYHGMSPSFNTMGDSFSESEDSYSFTYIVTTMAALCCVYLLFHYRNKLLALALEGRKGRGSRGRGRPSSANYSKLHSNLEEAIASNVTTPSATHVLY
ncbi:trans-Golgi network integral membrane protein 1 isoform X2 [Halyomorpha halys]|uniref:trans-Golgi network integral membrane protein 1 isoform X2 n=1 Tax=Halyomorpha halys TaxID=286706 RepID=UPI0006D51C55|nr:trans-Golgi network integral membrane protein 1-like isoform X2 [Halyomorpha halys]